MKISCIIFILNLVLCFQISAQRIIKGTVTDKSGEALIGADIVVKKSSIRTLTDFDGKFSLSIPDNGNMLVISYTGYKDTNVELGTSNIVDVYLIEKEKKSALKNVFKKEKATELVYNPQTGKYEEKSSYNSTYQPPVKYENKPSKIPQKKTIQKETSLTQIVEKKVPGSKLYAVFFATQDYEEWTPLSKTIFQATTVANELHQEYGFNIKIIKNPKQGDIYDALTVYQNMSYASNSKLLIFFSGHGEFIEENAEGFYIPKDGKKIDKYQKSYVPFTRLERRIDKIPCKHILLAIDACYSGTFDPSIAMLGTPQWNRVGITQTSKKEDFIRRLQKAKSRLFLTSGGKERTPEGTRYSPFVTQILEGLRSYGGKDGILTFEELVVFMQKAVPMPRYGKFGSHEPGGNFIFIAQ